ncbi:MAG: glycosyl hydrolase, partial [Eubacteriales bacterium]|nr:glycosyl hydrolase [Eubacteriales bacterium]
MNKGRKVKQAMACAVTVAMLTGNLLGTSVPAYGAAAGYPAVTETPGAPTVVEGISIPPSVRLVDEKATSETAELYAYLKGVGQSSYVLYGHQNDTHHKGGRSYEGSSTSDTRDLTGSIAAICGIDSLSLTGAELGLAEGKKDSVDEAAALSIKAAAEGSIIEFSAHMPNFALVAEKGKDADGEYDYSGYSPNDTTGNVMDKILPGGELNEVFTGFLDIVADYGLQLQEAGVPVLFRPFHENNGSWFWWGAAFCDEEGYKNVYRYTVEYLRDVKGVHNFLYVYSPNGPFKDMADYESRYPGDGYVDIVGFDMYHDNPGVQDEWMKSFRETVELVDAVAEKHGKIPTVAETGMRVTTSLGDGSNYSGIAVSGNRRKEWFSEIEEIVAGSDMPYFMVWANFDEKNNFFAPYKVNPTHGHEMSDAFIRFYNSDRSVFADGTNQEQLKAAPAVRGYGMSGYFLSPTSGGRMIKPGKIRASLHERAEGVQFVLHNEDRSVEILLDAEEVASFDGMRHVYAAQLNKANLDALGKTIGTMELRADGTALSSIQVLYGIEEVDMDPLMVDQFETYLG